MKLLGTLLLATALGLQTVAADAETAARTVGGTSIKFAVPKGYCVLSEDNKADARFIKVVRALYANSGNTHIVSMAECGALTAFRTQSGSYISDWVDYYTPSSEVNEIHAGDRKSMRKAMCDDWRKQGSVDENGVKDAVARAAKNLKTNMAVNNVRFIGVVDEDDHGCYAEMLVGISGDRGSVVQSIVVISTLVEGKYLYSALHRDFVGPETVENELSTGKAAMSEFDSENRRD